MKNKPKEPPQIAVKFANIVFVLGILFSILLIVYGIYKTYNILPLLSPVFYILSILSGGVFATLFGLGLKRLSNNLKVNLSMLFFITGITIYGIETCSMLIPQREIISKLMGVQYDTRTKMEVLDDLNDSGVKAIPKLHAKPFAESNGLNTKKGRIYPLGTISNSTTILDND